MPTLFKAALLGILQGLTEFLPVSSTAHLLIGGRLLGYDDPGGVFVVMIQLGSIFAVMWLYREKLIAVLVGLPSNPDARHFASMIAVATLPALVAGAVLSKFVKTVLYASFGVIGTAFIAGGIIMLLVERFRPKPDVLTARVNKPASSPKRSRAPPSASRASPAQRRAPSRFLSDLARA